MSDGLVRRRFRQLFAPQKRTNKKLRAAGRGEGFQPPQSVRCGLTNLLFVNVVVAQKRTEEWHRLFLATIELQPSERMNDSCAHLWLLRIFVSQKRA